jgi:thiamine transport system permease protein
MIKGVLLTAAGYAAIISVGEFGATSFLAYGSEGTIPTLLFRLIARPGEQNYGMAMAVSGVLIVSVWAVMLLVGSRSKTSVPSRPNDFLG